jgi:hypothetical protein
MYDKLHWISLYFSHNRISQTEQNTPTHDLSIYIILPLYTITPLPNHVSDIQLIDLLTSTTDRH